MDNRDSGLSTHLTQYDGLPWYRRRRAYPMRAMADDVVAVIDALGVSRAHLLGASLGGVIAQVTAVHHPRRVASLTLLYATPGSKLRLARPRIRTIIRMMRVMRGAAADPDAEGQRWVELMRIVGSPDHQVDEDHWRAAGRLAHQRGSYAPGSLRHTTAFMGVRDLRAELATLTIPTLVVQGEADPVQSWRAGRSTADAIPGARFLLLPGVGHELPRAVWPTVLDEITALAARGTEQPDEPAPA